MAGKTGLHLSQERQMEQYALCDDGLDGFIFWCENYARIEDKDTHRAVPFKLYSCQKRIIKRVFLGKWLRVLKARRLGVTWLFAAYAVWLMTFRKMRTVGYLIHKKKYSQDFIDRCDFIASRIPLWLRPVPTGANKNELDFKDCEGWIRALTATKGAADSVAADMVIVDEATKIEENQAGLLGSILQSIEPTVETAKGIIVLIAKSEGPQGLFYRGWKASEKGNDRYENVFLSWRMRPGRTQTWYANETRLHESDPLFMPRNYPATAEEAFQQAEGRVYTSFNTATHVGRILPDGNLAAETDQPLWVPGHCPKWRAIDFGGRDPFVCLWIMRVAKEGIRLTIDPACEKTIGEFLSYRYKPHTDYFEDKNNHACFAAGTMIETQWGPRPIEHIAQDDVVRSHLGYTKVLAVNQTGTRPLVRMEFTQNNGPKRWLAVTPEHPIAVHEGGFLPFSLMDVNRKVDVMGPRKDIVNPDGFDHDRALQDLFERQRAAWDSNDVGPDVRRAEPRRWVQVAGARSALPIREAPVWNLATGHGTYFANGVLVSNCDSLRYAVETFVLQKGWYHIYRELYLPNSAADGLEVPDLAAMIVDMSGDEHFNMTVADRSQPTSINSLQLHKIPCMANMHYLKEGASRRSLIAQGVRMVNALLIGTKEFLPARVRTQPSPEDAVRPPSEGVSVSLAEARLLRKKREKRTGIQTATRSRRQMKRTRRLSRRPTFS